MKKLVCVYLIFLSYYANCQEKKKLHSNYSFKILTMDEQTIKGRLYKSDSTELIIRQLKWNKRKDSLIVNYINIENNNIKSIKCHHDNMVYFGALSGILFGVSIGIINVYQTPAYSDPKGFLFTQREEAAMLIPYISAGFGIIGATTGLIKLKYKINGDPKLYNRIQHKLKRKMLR